jgi:hypothetical protein
LEFEVMTSRLTRASLGMMVLVLGSIVTGGGVSFGQSRPGLGALGHGPTKATRHVAGVASCLGCHGSPELRNDLCRMIEYKIWNNSDPHRRALDWGKKDDKPYRSTSAERAWAIGERLNIADVTTSSQCAGCHSVLVPAGTGKEPNFRPRDEGVTCVACHGAYREWVQQHFLTGDTPWSRVKTRREKWEGFGMVDLWDPVVRAQTCMSCHIGDPDPCSGKSITHAMYAAGHPPLPSIEVAAFSEQQPQHWLHLRCKNDQARRRLKFNPDRLEQTEQVSAGGLAALYRLMELFEADARAPEQSARPELARFDCYACHHELKSPGAEAWRPARVRGGAGRPASPVWPMPLVHLGIDAADPGQFSPRVTELDDRLAEFHAALAARPFGDPEATAKAARAVIQSIEPPLAELSRLASVEQGAPGRVLNQAEALRLLRRLCEIGGKAGLDYESARQIAWGFRIINQELHAVTAGRLGGNNRIKILANNQPQIQEILQALDTDLVLSLRHRSNLATGGCPPPDHVMVFPTTPDQQPLVGPVLDARLQKLADCNPLSFRDRLARLARLVPAP